MMFFEKDENNLKNMNLNKRIASDVHPKDRLHTPHLCQAVQIVSLSVPPLH